MALWAFHSITCRFAAVSLRIRDASSYEARENGKRMDRGTIPQLDTAACCGLELWSCRHNTVRRGEEMEGLIDGMRSYLLNHDGFVFGLLLSRFPTMLPII